MKNYIFSHYEQYTGYFLSDREFSIRTGFDELQGFKLFFKSKMKNIPDSHLLFFSNFKCKEELEHIEFIKHTHECSVVIPACERYRIYLNYINENSFDEDSNFVFCDCRDVIFHKNVFELLKYYPNNTIIFGNESCEFPIKNEPHNSSWLINQNAQNIERIGNELIICSGVFIIKGLELTKLLLSQFNILLEYYIKIAKRKGINDQGIFNEMYYNILKNYKNNVMVLRNEQNPLFVHLGLCENQYCKYENGKFLFLDRELEPCIIHQYDRHDNLVNEFRNEYLI